MRRTVAVYYPRSAANTASLRDFCDRITGTHNVNASMTLPTAGSQLPRSTPLPTLVSTTLCTEQCTELWFGTGALLRHLRSGTPVRSIATHPRRAPQSNRPRPQAAPTAVVPPLALSVGSLFVCPTLDTLRMSSTPFPLHTFPHHSDTLGGVIRGTQEQKNSGWHEGESSRSCSFVRGPIEEIGLHDRLLGRGPRDSGGRPEYCAEVS